MELTWMTLLIEIFKVVIIPLLGVLTTFLIKFINSKSKELAAKTDSEQAKKYIEMLDNTISTCVLSTTQTYVEALKKEGKFDLEAQKKAFEMTYQAILNILTEESKAYLTSLYGDLKSYLTAKIEAEVKSNKIYN